MHPELLLYLIENGYIVEDDLPELLEDGVINEDDLEILDEAHDPIAHGQRRIAFNLMRGLKKDKGAKSVLRKQISDYKATGGGSFRKGVRKDLATARASSTATLGKEKVKQAVDTTRKAGFLKRQAYSKDDLRRLYSQP